MLAMPYQPGSPDVHLNTWVTMFASQAVALAVPGAEPLRWDQLVRGLMRIRRDPRLDDEGLPDLVPSR